MSSPKVIAKRENSSSEDKVDSLEPRQGGSTESAASSTGLSSRTSISFITNDQDHKRLKVELAGADDDVSMQEEAIDENDDDYDDNDNNDNNDNNNSGSSSGSEEFAPEMTLETFVNTYLRDRSTAGKSVKKLIRELVETRQNAKDLESDVKDNGLSFRSQFLNIMANNEIVLKELKDSRTKFENLQSEFDQFKKNHGAQLSEINAKVEQLSRMLQDQNSETLPHQARPQPQPQQHRPPPIPQAPAPIPFYASPMAPLSHHQQQQQSQSQPAPPAPAPPLSHQVPAQFMTLQSQQHSHLSVKTENTERFPLRQVQQFPPPAPASQQQQQATAIPGITPGSSTSSCSSGQNSAPSQFPQIPSVQEFSQPAFLQNRSDHSSSSITQDPHAASTLSSSTIPSPQQSASSDHHINDLQYSPGSNRGSAYKYALLKQITSIRQIWQEYAYGLNGQPSIKSLQIKYKTKWRYPEDASTFKRRKRIYKAIEIAMLNGLSEKEAITELENHRLDKEGNYRRSLQWLCDNIPDKFKGV